jgi:hypothetical protein
VSPGERVIILDYPRSATAGFSEFHSGTEATRSGAVATRSRSGGCGSFLPRPDV